MNRVVRLGDVLVRLGVLAIVLLLPCLLAGQQQKPQDQGVPDAPTPQQPDSLGNLTIGCDARQGNASETPPTKAQIPPGAACPDARSPHETRYSRATRHPPAGGRPKGHRDLPRQSRLCAGAGNGAGQETSTGRRADVAGFSDLREQRAPAYRHLQCRCRGPLRCPGDRPEPAPGHHEEGERQPGRDPGRLYSVR